MPWNLEVVPEPKSPNSINVVWYPLRTKSRATPHPVAPPPITIIFGMFLLVLDIIH